MNDWSKLKEFEVVYEAFDYFLKKEIVEENVK